MAMQYRYLIDQAVDEMIENASRRDQRVLRDFFRFLGRQPSTVGDEQVPDASGRVNQVKWHDRFVITYWVDHLAHEVRIVAVEFL